jgi:hypothetical protein
MPGAGSTTVGYAAFCAVKLAGYSLSTFYFCKRHRARSWPSWLFGPARTVLGIGAGMAVALALARMESLPLFLVSLLPVRIGEWLLVLWLFFGRGAIARRRWFVDAVVGTVWSYALDFIGLLAAFAVPGGFWVC